MSTSKPETRRLPELPSSPVSPEGRLTLGRFTGASDEVRWGYPTGWLDGQRLRALGRKRWFQLIALSPERVVVVRILDQGLVGSGFVWVADPRTGRTELEHRLPGVPLANLAVGPVAGRGAHAFVTLPNAKVVVRRDGEATAWALNVQLPGHAISLTFDTRRAIAPLTTIDGLRPGSSAPEATRGVLIQRHVGLEVRGTVRFRSEVVPLEGQHIGVVEYGNGFVLSPDAPEDNTPNASDDFGLASWSSALVLPTPPTTPGTGEHPAVPSPWLAMSDLGAGGAFAWRDGAPVELSGPLTWQTQAAGSEHQPWRLSAPSLDLTFQPRCVAIEKTGAPALIARARPLEPVAHALGMRHALVCGLFSGTLQGPRGPQETSPQEIRALGLCEARLFGG